MECRVLGPTGLRVSRVGFGCIRLGGCTQAEVTDALRVALDLGINLVDTARAYGDSEAKLGRALGADRQRFVLCTKSLARDAAGVRADLQTSLRHLRTEAVDVFYLHSVSDLATYDAVTGPGGALEAALEARAQGRVRHLGISVHRDHRTMRRAIESGRFEVIMLAYSAIDQEAVESVLSLAARAGLGTVVMKALSGGHLTSPPRPDGTAVAPDPIVEAALRWVAGNPDVSAVIPGMVSAQQVRDNVAAVARGPLSAEEQAELRQQLGRLQRAYRYGQTCLRCNYCQPCPRQINVPAILRAADVFQGYPAELRGMGTELYRAQRFTAEHCDECRRCVQRCPAGINVPDRLRRIAALFESA